MSHTTKQTDLVCNSVSAITAITTEAFGKTFKILPQSTTWNCGSEKVLDLLKYTVCCEALYTTKVERKLRYRLNNYKSKQKAFSKGNRKILQKVFNSYYYFYGHKDINEMHEH